MGSRRPLDGQVGLKLAAAVVGNRHLAGEAAAADQVALMDTGPCSPPGVERTKAVLETLW